MKGAQQKYKYKIKKKVTMIHLSEKKNYLTKETGFSYS